MQDANADQISEQLDTLIRLLALELTKGKTATDGIRLLKLAHMDNKTIAELLGLRPESVRAITSTLRRESTRRMRRIEND